MISLVRSHIIPAAYALLPPEMRSEQATRLLLAIGWQESRFKFRRQVPSGPARGFWQFELGGVRGVLRHEDTNVPARDVLQALSYPRGSAPTVVKEALEHNDVLAAAFARLLIWTLPEVLPSTADAGWAQYLSAWRPGRPHLESWDTAWELSE